MPTTVVNAIVDFIYAEAKIFNCYADLLKFLYEEQFHQACMALINQKWIATDIQLPDDGFKLPIQEMVFQFDNQKFGYPCFTHTASLAHLNNPGIDCALSAGTNLKRISHGARRSTQRKNLRNSALSAGENLKRISRGARRETQRKNQQNSALSAGDNLKKVSHGARRETQRKNQQNSALSAGENLKKVSHGARR